MFRSWAALALAIVALAGCGSVEASTPKAAAATPSLPCSLPYGTQVALVWPRPGSAGVAAGNAPVTVVASRELPKTVTVVAIGGHGSVTPGATLERTARPAHAAQAAWADPVYYRAGSVALSPHRHYTIALDDVAQNGCAPYVAISGNARFST
jgi:hypothetical protein